VIVPELAYVNGWVGPVEEAYVSVEDRGFQFADGVYEVAQAQNGVLLDLDRHLARLERSLAMLDMAPPMPLPELERTAADFYRSSGIDVGMLYLQVTRGTCARQHAPPEGLRPTLVMTARLVGPLPEWFKAITTPNNRWKLCACKSVALLPAVLAKQAARKAGADEAIFVDDDGSVLEGASTNVFVVKDGVAYTAETDGRILEGVTRGRVLELAGDIGLEVRVQRVPVELLRRADEVFLTSSVLTVVPFTHIDGRPVGSGRPGPVAGAVREAYWNLIDRLCPPAEAGKGSGGRS